MKRSAFFAAMLAIAASCGVNEIDNGSETTLISSLGTGNAVKAPDITAAFDEKATKSTITTDSEGTGTIWWTPADEINVFYDRTSTHYTSQNTENTTSATFSTTDEISTKDLASKNVWGLYPYDAAAVCDGSSVTTTIPASQSAVEGAFDDDLFTSLAHSDGAMMKFYNVLGGIKFSLSRDDVRSITFRGNHNEDIAGKVSLFMDKDGIPAASVVENEGMKSITLTPDEGTCFASDTFYYIVMLPVELSEGFTMIFDTDSDVLVLDSRSSVQIKRSVFKRAAEIDKRATAMSPFTISGNGFDISLKREGNPGTISLEYRFGNGDWKPYVIGTTLPADSDKPMNYQDMTLQFRAGKDGNKNFSKDKENYYYFECMEKVNISGNIMSLLDATMQDNTLYDYAFYQLFYKNACIVDASKLELPATVLAPHCYDNMFSMCWALTSAPELPATTLAEGCYKYMFLNCLNLESSPDLPATTLAKSCYEGMFSNCEKMSAAPELPATTLEEGCYSIMFNNCEGLSAAPELPATTLAKECYYMMFTGCSGLTKAPELPVTTLAEGCYRSMFYDCDSLESMPELPATTLAEYCYGDMFSGCIKLTEVPALPVKTLAKSCYSGMFSRCTGLESAPELPLTDLAEYCYYGMFQGCTALTKAPELPATTLAESCYRNMFSDCTNLTEAPYLPAKTLAASCYVSMFYGCTSLKAISVEFTDWQVKDRPNYPATDNWLRNASTTGVFYCPPTLDVSTRNTSYVPEGWEVRCNPLKSITLEPAEFNILVGETSAAPTVIFDPEYVVNRNISWSSSNESIAKVDASGRVTGIAEGTSTITAVSEEGGKTSKSTVTVTGVGPADLPGTFSVSNGSKVLFSRGNLYWNGAKWRFESNQYDFPLTWDPKHVGHLAWVKDEAKAVSGTWDNGWISDCTSLFTNDPAQPQAPNPDFRIYEAKGKYRTLTSDEWNYLLKGRMFNGNKSGAGYSYEIVFDQTIGGVKVFGLFIFPDGFTKQDSWKTEYTTWNAINAAGIVFLPAAGFREGSEMYIHSVNESYGYYWTSSFDHKSDRYSYGKDLKFDVNPDSTGDSQLNIASTAASDAHSVRLVTSSEPAIGTLYIFDGIVGMYVGNTSDGKKLIVATKNYGSASATVKGTAFTREELNSLSIPSGWQLPTAADMEILAKLGFKDDSKNDGAYNSRYDFFIPYTQDVAENRREGRIWVVGGSDNDFYWFRSDDKYGLTKTQTVKPNYYVRLVKKL